MLHIALDEAACSFATRLPHRCCPEGPSSAPRSTLAAPSKRSISRPPPVSHSFSRRPAFPPNASHRAPQSLASPAGACPHPARAAKASLLPDSARFAPSSQIDGLQSKGRSQPRHRAVSGCRRPPRTNAPNKVRPPRTRAPVPSLFLSKSGKSLRALPPDLSEICHVQRVESTLPHI